MDLGLTDKVALVAASSKGLGFATAMELATEGAKVMLCGRDVTNLDLAVSRIANLTGDRDKVAGLAIDLMGDDSARKLVNETATKFGGLDILITNAGGPPNGSFDSTDQDAWSSGIQLTLMSAVNLISQALPHLRKSDDGAILTITSITVKQPISGLMLSNAIRPAVVGLTKDLSQELGPEGLELIPSCPDGPQHNVLNR